MRTNARQLAMAILFGLYLTGTSHAQLFGNRTVGSPLGPARGNAAGASNSSLGGMAPSSALANYSIGETLTNTPNRFVRGNRNRQDFVGSSRSDVRGFVGNEQALGVGRVPTAVESMKIETTSAARVNRPMPAQPSKGMYLPRLDIASNALPAQADRDRSASPDLVARVTRIAGSNTPLSIRGSTAILNPKGMDPSKVELLRQVLLFEPGIDAVEMAP